MKLIDLQKSNNVILEYLISSQAIYEALHIPIQDLEIEEDASRASLVFTPRVFFQGYENVVHGGLVTTFLDSVGAILALYFSSLNGKKFALTNFMRTEFLHKVYVNKEIKVVANLETSQKNELFVTAVIFQKRRTSPTEERVAIASMRFKIVE